MLCYHPPPIDQRGNTQKMGSSLSSKHEISTGCGRSQCDWQEIQTCFLFARVWLVFYAFGSDVGCGPSWFEAH